MVKLFFWRWHRFLGNLFSFHPPSQSMKNVSSWWQGRPLSGGQCHGSATSGKPFLAGQKAPSGCLRGGKAPAVAILTCNSKAVQGLFLPHKNTSFCYALRSRGLKVVYKNGRGGVGEGWYALRRLEQDPCVGRRHRLAGELWLSVWVWNPLDFNIPMSS